MVLGTAVLVAAIVSVSASDGTTASNATLTVTGSGAVTYTPDVAKLGFSAESQATTAAAAIDANAALAPKILNALTAVGAKNLATQAITLSPIFNRSNTAIAGFQARNGISDTIEIDKTAAAIDNAVAAGWTAPFPR